MASDRIKIADVVARTGLSRSTVDRVLNGRPGVQSKTQERVKNALRDLGYSKSTLDFLSQYRSKEIHAILPRGSNPFFEEIRRGIESAAADLAQFGCTVTYAFFDPYAPDSLLQRLQEMGPETDAIITLGVDSPELSKQITALNAAGIRVVTVVSEAPYSRRAIYVGQDNYSAGRTAARLMSGFLPDGPGSVGVILGHMDFRHLLDRQSGFQQVMAQASAQKRIVHTPPYGGGEDGRGILRDLFAAHADLQGLYIAGGGQPVVIEELSQKAGDLVVIGHELNSVTRAALAEGVYSALICHDVQEVGKKAIEAAMHTGDPTDTFCAITIFLKDNLPP